MVMSSPSTPETSRDIMTATPIRKPALPGEEQTPKATCRPRKRTRRACDKCNASRTRCNGEHPCGRCQEYGYDCNYNRRAKKRGRVALKDKQEAPRSTPSSYTSENAASISTGAMDENSIQEASFGTETSGISVPKSASLSLEHPPPHVDVFGQHHSIDSQSASSLQQSELSSRVSRHIENFHLGGSSADSFQGSPAAQSLFAQHTPGLSFSLAGPPGILDQHSPNNQVAECRYRCLEPLLPYTGRNFPMSVACDLFENYLLDPGASLFGFSSPFILTRIFRRQSLLGPNPRQTSPALLATILWCCARTADISVLLVPGARAKLTNSLYELATYLVSGRDPDRWRRIHGGLQIERDQDSANAFPEMTNGNEPAGTVDDVLTFLLLCIGVSAGDFKSDSLKWWSKANRLALSLGLNCQDAVDNTAMSPPQSLAEIEAQEERRRVFWLLYAIDRHLALSYNRVLNIPDSICDVYAPLPEAVWENLGDMSTLPPRTLGPPLTITGTGIFEYFLPLMVILGDIIEVHHGQYHPRLGTLDKKYAEGAIAELIAGCEASLGKMAREAHIDTGPHSSMRISTIVSGGGNAPPSEIGDKLEVRLVIAYSTFILHVLHVLFYGKWDAICMLDNEDDWITTPRFAECAYHAIEASEAVADILRLDPELTFMPYLFGIYLLHGSFILLLFADRMPQLGQNQSVEQACETIIRAHEVCVVTLSTEFQRNFRRVLRSTLYNVRGGSPNSLEEHRQARRQVLSLYRWNRGARGLGI